MSQYPQSLEAALGKPLKFPPATLEAVRAFASSKPWRGSFDERQAKFRELHADLSRVYSVNPTLVIEADRRGDSACSSFQPGGNVITLTGRLSVFSFLHEWGQPRLNPLGMALTNVHEC